MSSDFPQDPSDSISNAFTSDFGTHSYDVPSADPPIETNDDTEDDASSPQESGSAEDPFEPGVESAVDFDIGTFDQNTEILAKTYEAYLGDAKESPTEPIKVETTPPMFSIDAEVSDDDNDPESPSDKLLDTMSETNRNSDAIVQISAQLESIVQSLSAMSEHMAQSDKKVDEVASSLENVKGDMKQLRESAMAFQTTSMNNIARVERRAHNKTAEADPKPLPAVIPDKLVHKDVNSIIVAAQERIEPKSAGTSASAKPAPLVKMSDWL